MKFNFTSFFFISNVAFKMLETVQAVHVIFLLGGSGLELHICFISVPTLEINGRRGRAIQYTKA